MSLALDFAFRESYLKMLRSPLHDYILVISMLGLSYLAEQRHAAGLKFIEGLLN